MIPLALLTDTSSSWYPPSVPLDKNKIVINLLPFIGFQTLMGKAPSFFQCSYLTPQKDPDWSWVGSHVCLCPISVSCGMAYFAEDVSQGHLSLSDVNLTYVRVYIYTHTQMQYYTGQKHTSNFYLKLSTSKCLPQTSKLAERLWIYLLGSSGLPWKLNW